MFLFLRSAGTSNHCLLIVGKQTKLNHSLVVARVRPRKCASIEFHIWAKTHKCNLTRRLWNEGYIHWKTEASKPSFSTRLKAAYIRALIPWVSQQAIARAAVRPSDYNQIRATSVWGLAQYLRVLDRSGLVMTEVEASDAYAAARLHMECYQRLTCLAHEKSSGCYRVRPKWHYFDHSVDYMRHSLENPRFFHNFRGEELMEFKMVPGTKSVKLWLVKKGFNICLVWYFIDVKLSIPFEPVPRFPLSGCWWM